MKNPEYHGIEEYLAALESALGRPHAQCRDIVEEVRADLTVRVEQLQTDGLPHPDAVQRALGDLGNPYELAHQMKQELPPFGGTAVSAIRYVAAGGLALWLGVLLWLLRGWSYGLSGIAVTLTIMFLHLPVILLLWPRIVWRRNWLFGLIPAGAALLVVLALNFTGTESTQVIMELDKQGNPAIEVPVANPADEEAPRVWLLLALVGFAVILLLSMQQRHQRRIALAAIVLPIAVVEIAFQLDELQFRNGRDRVRDYADTVLRVRGVYPTAEDFDADRPGLVDGRVRFDGESASFYMSRARPLCSGFAIAYSSKDDRLWIQD